MGLFNRRARAPARRPTTNKNMGEKTRGSSGSTPNDGVLPQFNHNGDEITRGIHPDGESGRRGVHPVQFFRIIWKSSCTVSSWVNVLWPFVPAAIALHFIHGDHHLWTFAINYIAMIPAANLLGFAGQEFARKLPKVAGIIIETTLGSVVEIVLFMVLIAKDNGTGEAGHGNKIQVIQAAILGSILTNLLLCLGSCFLIGGLKHKEQRFHAAISEVGSGLILVAGFALMIPSAFFSSLIGSTSTGGEGYTEERLRSNTLSISHGVSIILMVSFMLYLLYNCVSHDNIFAEVLEADEEADRDRHIDLAKAKLTMTECLLAIVLALALISLIAVFLVEEIEYVVEHGIPDNFLGLILVPLVEKAAEHLTAVDEAYDNQINFALYHCLGPSIQTALFNAPLVVIVGWGLGKPMDLNFEIFQVVLLIVAILVVGNFLRDGSSNYLEGGLLVIVYIIIAVTAWYYPNAELTSSNGRASTESGGEGTEALASIAKMLMS
ncbi:Ca2+:H+ antiporter [Capronia coronata CBS 617.96]|uniref:Vacuolar calcium ion transporter n=1 Tax=Capronia coronata CBS 617.96 TaxID=1182541 RepID=W9Z1U9_9EURO|nr:Ca2+:H+ antiporter [Capronia coronata CBS 617.96]EXJ88484.1 Ca2+:H+ antiporter [Capronia coronata CBS 617.96]